MLARHSWLLPTSTVPSLSANLGGRCSSILDMMVKILHFHRVETAGLCVPNIN